MLYFVLYLYSIFLYMPACVCILQSRFLLQLHIYELNVCLVLFY